MRIRFQLPRGRKSSSGSNLESQRMIIRRIGSFLKRRKARGYVVGGFLRDTLMGKASVDLDIVVDGTGPEDVADHLHRNLGFSKPVFFPRFGTALSVGRGSEIQICQLEGDLERDAGRRDFTVNCLYADIGAVESLSPSKILDPTGHAVSDLKRRLLRTPSEPCLTLWLDPIRTLRAIRFHAVHGLVLDRQLANAIPRVAYLLGRMSVERIRMELEKILLSRRLRSSLRLMEETGVNHIILPELSRTYRFAQSTPYHAYDLFSHSVRTAAYVPPDLTLRLAGLLHDTGKFCTRADKSGRAVYYGHEKVSAEISASILGRLKFPKRAIRAVTFLVRNHMIGYSTDWSDRAIRRFVRKMGGHLEQMLVLVEADRKAQQPGLGSADGIRDLRRRIRALGRSDVLHPRLPVDGRAIMAILGIGQGPAVGAAKDFLLEEAGKRRRPMAKRECVRLLKEWAAAGHLR